MAKKKITEEEQPQISSYNVLLVRAELRRLIALVGEEVVTNELNNLKVNNNG